MTPHDEAPAASSSTAPPGPPARHGLRGWLGVLGPGVLVAATGVGAGDLATGALAGAHLGTTVLWAVLVGALIKLSLNEGLARWQLATGETLLEGIARHGGRWLLVVFLIYMVAWSWFTGAALISACGVAAHAICPWRSPDFDKLMYGAAHSLVAVILVLLGGYRWFERVMACCIALMFATVVLTAAALVDDWGAVLRGVLVPTVRLRGDGAQWTLALIGGVGGTLTVLCYGYWIREERREGLAWLRDCRVDLAVGYGMTALFGMAMVVLGARLGELEGKGASLVVRLADDLRVSLGAFGPAARWAFLLGAWGAVASSLLGVWQSVPYLFSDALRLLRDEPQRREVDVRSRPYIAYLLLQASIPWFGLSVSFARVQKAYALFGAAFLPLLALSLLALNRRPFVPPGAANSRWNAAALALVLVFFVVYGVLGLLVPGVASGG